MKPTLQFRIAQQLTLTPQLQQAIRMLQMSSLELAQELEQALRDNPFLESRPLRSHRLLPWRWRLRAEASLTIRQGRSRCLIV
ncbi:MAG: hypothetical protein EBS75_06255 [Betaproteobacteria bacterium]|nr:hypothetical protein [Betaproteobacteria bacterium]